MQEGPAQAGLLVAVEVEEGLLKERMLVGEAVAVVRPKALMLEAEEAEEEEGLGSLMRVAVEEPTAVLDWLKEAAVVEEERVVPDLRLWAAEAPKALEWAEIQC